MHDRGVCMAGGRGGGVFGCVTGDMATASYCNAFLFTKKLM